MTPYVIGGAFVAYCGLVLLVCRCMAFGMGTLGDTVPDVSSAGRTLSKLSDAELRRRKDALHSQLADELGRKWGA